MASGHGAKKSFSANAGRPVSRPPSAGAVRRPQGLLPHAGALPHAVLSAGTRGLLRLPKSADQLPGTEGYSMSAGGRAVEGRSGRWAGSAG